jgi:hypothetical protein
MLVMRNLENLRWETTRSIDESFRTFSAELDANLANTIETTRGTIRSARTLREAK